MWPPFLVKLGVLIIERHYCISLYGFHYYSRNNLHHHIAFVSGVHIGQRLAPALSHLLNRFLEVFHKLAAIVFIPSIEGDEDFAVDVRGQADTVLVVWGGGGGSETDRAGYQM